MNELEKAYLIIGELKKQIADLKTKRQSQDMTYAEAIGELYIWQLGKASFSSGLFDLIAKADSGNRERIAKGFPMRCQAYEDWYEATDPDQFFLSHGFGKKKKDI